MFFPLSFLSKFLIAVFRKQKTTDRIISRQTKQTKLALAILIGNWQP